MLPLCPFPSTYWCRLALQESSVLLHVHEHYVKQTYRNRYELLAVNGRTMLTIPVKGQKGQKIPFHEIEIAEERWRKLHLAAIRSAYGRAAFFEFCIDDLERIFEGNQSYLKQFNEDTLQWVKRWIPDLAWHVSESPIPYSAYTEDDKARMNSFEPAFVQPPQAAYLQVFSDRFEFQSGLSVLDLIMNHGKRAGEILRMPL